MRELRFGSDRVVIGADGLSIYACAMDGWRASAHRPLAVYFEGTRYRLVRATPIPGALVHYELVPWTGGALASQEVVYDEAFVEGRDGARDEVLRLTRHTWVLVPLYPLLGFLWSSTRRAVRERYGLGRRAPALSFALQSIVVLLLGTWVLTAFISPVWWVVAMALAVDVAIRWASSLRDEVTDPYGFGEWMFRRLR